ncbi:hypothetical protein [Martelella alba]|uniref:Uncharacterized protein n=1 Tax=Martelella alba TaxID=2590451 RepID=A0ABY2SIF8_9HYPH|nr:hypothetical protein [Martelella alba]TKI02741.1 hypothetical protein FCN80_24170 [Martelella alba]
MKIDRALNLVIPITDGEGKPVYVHSMPIGREVYERYFLTLSKTFAGIYAEGLNVLSGPKVASLMLKQTAMKIGDWDGDEGVGNGLMGEIHRLTNVIAPTKSGWKSVPLEAALAQKLISDDDYYDIEGQIVFFICVSAVHRKTLILPTLESMSSLWDVQITSSNCTEFASSLPTLTPAANTGETETLSVIPS